MMGLEIMNLLEWNLILSLATEISPQKGHHSFIFIFRNNFKLFKGLKSGIVGAWFKIVLVQYLYCVRS